MSIESETAPSPHDVDGAWRDRLVELHVLAEHGDEVAAAEARAWTGSDERARRAWEEIDSDCRRMRGA